MLTDEQFWGKIIIEALEDKAENRFLDFKLKLSDKNERVKEHINAFGNLERGGCFVFGVDGFTAIGMQDEWDVTIKK